jgi:H+-translocating NAD(P) transhydrogenase subunit beta
VNLLSPTWTAVGYLIAAVCFILALKGLSSPASARRGNQIGAGGAVLAVLVTFFSEDLRHIPLIVAAIVVGTAVGVPAARRVAMTQMPQLVALFNGVGGAAAALVAGLELSGAHGLPGGASTGSTSVAAAAGAFTVLVGAVSFSGSCVTFAKLQELMTTRPVTFPGGPYLFGGSLAAGVALAVAVVVDASDTVVSPVLLLALAVVALLVGVLFVLPVGGADVPIVISLLNAFTGLSAAATGVALNNTALIVAGMIVGASGSILTNLMAQAMNRSIPSIVAGGFGGVITTGGTTDDGVERVVRSTSASDAAVQMAYANRVVIVPGYGMAVAQAQHAVREMTKMLEAKGIEVSFAIHPVAGRMPGHMNVLLAEADVPYDQLKEMDEANAEFGRTDVSLVIGANDVTNPDARNKADSPIYGMPILNVDESASVIVLKRSMNSGFAGIDNPLFYNDKTAMLFGDAKSSVGEITEELKAL